MKETAGKLQ